ncbi:MAG TPA: DUF1800 family protein, partial [Pyrinomonadaceae bacterium]
MKVTGKRTISVWLAIRKTTALMALAALLSGLLTAGMSAHRASAPAKTALSEEQRILHVLNRLGFGARPGDVERVRAMGIEKYINQQLFPEKINDSASEARLQNLKTLRMTTAQLYEKYPQPGQLLRQLERRNNLPADLAAARDNRTKGKANAAPTTANNQKPGEAMSGEMQGPPSTAANTTNDANPMNNAEYRRAVFEYFKENNLRPPQFMTGELQMSRILRAVYSERQLQEVM